MPQTVIFYSKLENKGDLLAAADKGELRMAVEFSRGCFAGMGLYVAPPPAPAALTAEGGA